MNRVTTLSAFGCLVLAGGVFADDTMSSATMTKHQAMKDCIEQQKSANVNMSKSAMKRFCKDRLKEQKATGAMPQEPPTDVPRN